MNKIILNENDIKNIIYKSIKKILFENNFKTPFHKRRAAIAISGRKQGKNPEEIRQDILDDMAKQIAIKDINNDRSYKTMSRHDRKFNNSVNDDTFNVNFEEINYYDPNYDDFTKNNKPMEGSNEP